MAPVGGLGSVLREARVASGLSQAEVGRSAGVDQSMVSVYERDRREPTWPTFERLLQAAHAVPEVRSEALPPNALTLSGLGVRLAATREERRRRRLVLGFLVLYLDTPSRHRRALVVERPGATGSKQWDALLGAFAEHFAFHDAFDPPAWCTDADRFLATPWFWISLPSVRERALRHAPTSFRRRNVWIDRADLERV